MATDDDGQETYVLIRLDPQPKPIYFIVSDKVYPHCVGDQGVIGSEERNENHKFWYDENTCPMNFLKNIQEVVQLTPDEIHKCDEDPHGLFTYVGEIPVEAADGKVWNGSEGDGTTWLQAFGVEYE